MKEVGELETRKKILTLVQKQPGLTMSKIAEFLKMDPHLVLYHLRFLEKQEVLTLEREKGFTRCFVRGETPVVDRRLLGVLRQAVPLRIVLFLLEHPHSKHHEILKHLSVSKSTLSYHLKKLLRRGVIAFEDSGNESGYIVVDPKAVIQVLLKYRPPEVIAGFKDTWDVFSARKR